MAENMEVTKRVEFECCYIQNHQIEAHRCKLEVTIEGPQRFEDFGRVISYEQLQAYMNSIVPHKAFLYCKDDAVSVNVAKAFVLADCRTVEYDFEVSAENLCADFAKSLQMVLNTFEPGLIILNLKFREDNNSYVSWSRNTTANR